MFAAVRDFFVSSLSRMVKRDEGESSEYLTLFGTADQPLKITNREGSSSYIWTPDGGRLLGAIDQNNLVHSTVVNEHTDLVATIGGDGNTITSSNIYTPFGEVQSHTGTLDLPLTFQSDYTDGGTGLVDMGRRNYDPSLGTFTTPDPRAPEVTDPYSYNTYLYANDCPTAFIDPTGEQEIPPEVQNEIDFVAGFFSLFLPPSLATPVQKANTMASNVKRWTRSNRSTYADMRKRQQAKQEAAIAAFKATGVATMRYAWNGAAFAMMNGDENSDSSQKAMAVEFYIDNKGTDPGLTVDIVLANRGYLFRDDNGKVQMHLGAMVVDAMNGQYGKKPGKGMTSGEERRYRASKDTKEYFNLSIKTSKAISELDQETKSKIFRDMYMYPEYYETDEEVLEMIGLYRQAKSKANMLLEMMTMAASVTEHNPTSISERDTEFLKQASGGTALTALVVSDTILAGISVGAFVCGGVVAGFVVTGIAVIVAIPTNTILIPEVIKEFKDDPYSRKKDLQ